MATESKKSTPKVDAPAAKDKAEPKEKVATEAPAETRSDPAPSNYSRGEGQKAVTQAYRDNWDAIYGKKKKR